MPKFHTLETRKKMSRSAMGNKNAAGTIPSEETRHKIRLTKLGAKNPNFGKSTWNKGKKMSLEARAKLSASMKGRIPWNKSSNPLYTKEADILRKSADYRRWRLSVYRKDGFRCLDCGEKGKPLNADHIYPFAYYPRLRLDINNGRTLCVDCHKKTPTYGSKVLAFKPVLIPVI